MYEGFTYTTFGIHCTNGACVCLGMGAETGPSDRQAEPGTHLEVDSLFLSRCCVFRCGGSRSLAVCPCDVTDFCEGKNAAEIARGRPEERREDVVVATVVA